MAKLFSWGKSSPDESALIEALRQGADWAYKSLYKNCYPSVKRYVVNQGGSEDDAQEVFQEAVIQLFRNLANPGFELTAKVCTYLFSIAKYNWWKINRDRGRKGGYGEEPINPSPDPTDPLDGLPPATNKSGELTEDPFGEQDDLPSEEEVMEYINTMGEPCTETLRKHWINGTPLKEMAKEAGISEEAMRKRAFDCRKKVRNHFKNK